MKIKSLGFGGKKFEIQADNANEQIICQLHGYEKYVSLAGACLFFMGIVGLWTLILQARTPASTSET